MSGGRPRREDEFRYRQMAFTFVPTAGVIERLFEVHGFEWERVDWRDGRITDWTEIEDYRNQGRVTWVARRM